MKRVTAAGLTAVFIATSLAPAVAGAHVKKTTWTHRILHDYYEVVRKFGKRTAGRDIIRHGVNTNHGPQEASKKQKANFQRQLRKFLRPPALMWTQARPPAHPPAGTLSGFHVASLPSCTWKPESGGNYNAKNGIYWGKYQIGLDHWNLGHACYGLGKGPAGQEACAVRVYRTEGLGAWVNC